MLFMERLKGFANTVLRTKTGLIVDGMWVPKRRNVLAVLNSEEHGRRLIPASNIITDQGDIFYAQKIAGAAPTNNFNSLYLSTAAWDAGHPAKTSTSDNLASVITGSEAAVAVGYPLADDTANPDNTGAAADAVTWKFSYSKAAFAANGIVSGAISVAAVTSWGANAGTDQLLTGFTLASFNKTNNDTLDVYVNHALNGV